MVELKASESEANSDSESNSEGGKRIIDVEHSAMVATTKVRPSEPEEPEEGVLEYNGCARLIIDNITIVTQPYAESTPEHLNLDRESFWKQTLG